MTTLMVDGNRDIRSTNRGDFRPAQTFRPHHGIVDLGVITNSHMEVSHATQPAIHHQDGRSVEASD